MKCFTKKEILNVAVVIFTSVTAPVLVLMGIHFYNAYTGTTIQRIESGVSHVSPVNRKAKVGPYAFSTVTCHKISRFFHSHSYGDAGNPCGTVGDEVSFIYVGNNKYTPAYVTGRYNAQGKMASVSYYFTQTLRLNTLEKRYGKPSGSFDLGKVDVWRFPDDLLLIYSDDNWMPKGTASELPDHWVQTHQLKPSVLTMINPDRLSKLEGHQRMSAHKLINRLWIDSGRR